MATLKVKAYEHIRGKLLRGELTPGSRLSNRKLAAEIGVSFIPVREAISQLASEGLIELRPNLGAMVCTPTREEIRDLYDLRLALECHAVAVAARRIGRAEIEELETWNQKIAGLVDQFEQLPVEGDDAKEAELCDQWNITDAAFHLEVLRVAGNNLTIRTVTGLRVMTRVFGHRLKRSDNMIHRVCQEHDRIIGALRMGDAPWAARAMGDHLEQGREVALRAFDRRRASEAVDMNPGDNLQDRIRELEQQSL